MRLIIHSEASFLVEWDAKINYGGYFYIGWNYNDEEPQQINGVVDVSASLLPLVAISVAEAELGGTFYNAQKGKILRLTLKEMVWKQGQPQSLSTKTRQVEFATAQSNGNDREQLTANIFG